MGLENMGYVRMNLDALWIDPAEYQTELCEAVEVLDQNRLAVSIYNHQLCLLDSSLWPFARKSIADWKTEYLECCQNCAVREDCGGLFFSASIKRSPHIRAITHELLSQGQASGRPDFTTP
jgi:hypothetical protein